ncbi:protein of unknown function [Taphrina deformans PYCC 5710]|uniref:Mitochondrial import inner membrane translocase subunit TIM16 n=1 Tax=Taphrina deformans (strain PYCC 5710 / ATCC 11124 / CBS 356.35 / IMI 108563 / JCM 9778 / NBRC 8474) TaxID=1097556 RepID=R4XFG3_TAPDE|nr:protein of unknown function [Taphrina deformans PYCC 5710]|eukprot:CCG84413.1 protein of unknown function [Taphrina deformans PYCC 5710]
MAHRIIAQVVIVGTQVFGKAFISAWKQAAANSSRVASESSTGSVKDTITRTTGLSVGEACQILNIKKDATLKLEDVTTRYKTMFENNDPAKGGSFYIQSKVHRAMERLEMELTTAKEGAEGATAASEAGAKTSEGTSGTKPGV